VAWAAFTLVGRFNSKVAQVAESRFHNPTNPGCLPGISAFECDMA
jgi:hypothetical protein